jgi:hypothetical protein
VRAGIPSQSGIDANPATVEGNPPDGGFRTRQFQNNRTTLPAVLFPQAMINDDRDVSVPLFKGVLVAGPHKAAHKAVNEAIQGRKWRDKPRAEQVVLIASGFAGIGMPLLGGRLRPWVGTIGGMLLAMGIVMGALFLVGIFFYRRANSTIFRREFVKRGWCASCGYSLQRLPAAADGCVVCSECGAAWRFAGMVPAE